VDLNGGPVTGVVNNPAVSNPNEADLTEGNSTATGFGLANGNGAASNQVFLGTVTIIGGSSAGTTTFNLDEYNVNGFNSENTITSPNGYDLDNSNTTPVAYTGVGTTLTPFSVTTTLPEPASTMLFAFGGIAALLRRRRKA
jgi:hypothetical protein